MAFCGNSMCDAADSIRREEIMRLCEEVDRLNLELEELREKLSIVERRWWSSAESFTKSWIHLQEANRERDEAIRERDEALANGREVNRLVLDVVRWYFGQRRYSVTPSAEGGYYLHDNEGRYPKHIAMDDGSPKWPTVYMVLRRARDAAREGEG